MEGELGKNRRKGRRLKRGGGLRYTKFEGERGHVRPKKRSCKEVKERQIFFSKIKIVPFCVKQFIAYYDCFKSSKETKK